MLKLSVTTFVSFFNSFHFISFDFSMIFFRYGVIFTSTLCLCCCTTISWVCVWVCIYFFSLLSNGLYGCWINEISWIERTNERVSEQANERAADRMSDRDRASESEWNRERKKRIWNYIFYMIFCSIYSFISIRFRFSFCIFFLLSFDSISELCQFLDFDLIFDLDFWLFQLF